VRKRTKVALLLAVGAAVSVGITYILLRPSSPSSRINPRTYASIKEGMNREEVEAVVGLAPGEYIDLDPRPRTNEYIILNAWGTTFLPVARRASLHPYPADSVDWYGNDFTIEVEFDDEGKAIGGGIGKRDQPGSWPLVDRMKAWAGWLVHPCRRAMIRPSPKTPGSALSC
jgi:hypothetical protein